MKTVNKTSLLIVVGCTAMFNLPGYCFTIEVVPSSAPRGPSTTFDLYNTRALHSLENGLGAAGDPATDPAAYRPATSLGGGQFKLTTRELITSSFPSWRGQANPTGPFANEQGNRLHFGLRMLADGTPFSLAQLEFHAGSDDVNNTFDNAPATIFDASSQYNVFRIGIDYVNGQKGDGDDIVYSNGEAADLPIDELIYVGPGVAIPAEVQAGATDQEKLDNAIAMLNSLSPFNIVGTYTLFDDANHTTQIASGSASVLVVIPEPTTATCLLAVALTMLTVRRPRTAGTP